jgi:lipid A ethanolaminephosphotransferase
MLILCFKYTLKPLLIVLLLMSSVITYFASNFGVVTDESMLLNIIQTNAGESADLLSVKLALYVFLLGILPSLVVYKTTLAKSTIKKELLKRAIVLVALVIVFVLIVLSFSKAYASFAREHKHLKLYINPSYAIYSVGKYLNTQLDSELEDFQTYGEGAIISEKDHERELSILVVGETARADRFYLNGYERQTNPLLALEDVLSFNNVWSCDTSTARSLPCMFSMQGRDNYDRIIAQNSSNVLDVIQGTGRVEVLWRDNNDEEGSKGVADRVAYEEYLTSEVNPVCDIECRDEGMLVNLQDYIDSNPEKDMLIVLHMMGSHGPAYYKRYPSEFEIFKPACQTAQLSDCNDKEINNAYDNTILYTDYFLAKVIGLLKDNTNEFEASMIYIGDHGESLGEGGLYLHGLPYFMAPDEQKRVPVIIWMDGGDIREDVNYPELSRMTNKRLAHDNLFHLLLGIFEVNTELYQPTLGLVESH